MDLFSAEKQSNEGVQFSHAFRTAPVPSMKPHTVA